MASTPKKLLMNIPATVNTLQYLDVVPGTYGAQLKLKGTVDGEPNVGIYLPGKLWAVVKALKTAGVLAQDTIVPEEVTEATSVPFVATTFTITNKQVEGQKYANLDVRVAGAPQPKAKAVDPTPDWLKEDDDWEPIGAGTSATLVKPNATKAASATEAETDKLAALARIHARCVALAAQESVANDTAEAVSARAATIFIQAVQRGIA